MKTRANLHGWESRVAAIAFIVIAIVLIDTMTGAHALGATGRFLWLGIVFVARRIDVVILTIARRRFVRIFVEATAVGFGYLGYTVLNDAQMEKVGDWRDLMRTHGQRMRDGWRAVPTPWKFGVVGTLIASQIMLLPAWHEYLLLFPIGFMIPMIRNLYRWLFGRVADSILIRWYRRRFGERHDAMIERVDWLDACHQWIRLCRLRYLTAWRLWKHDPRYVKDAKTGKRRVNLIEPVRLWRNGALDQYVGKPLLAGYEGRAEIK